MAGGGGATAQRATHYPRCRRVRTDFARGRAATTTPTPTSTRSIITGTAALTDFASIGTAHAPSQEQSGEERP